MLLLITETIHINDSILNILVELMPNIHQDIKLASLYDLKHRFGRKLHFETMGIKNKMESLIPTQKLKEGFFNPKSAEISNLFGKC